jgi:tetratricopeptide (TPR) repeat protein
VPPFRSASGPALAVAVAGGDGGTVSSTRTPGPIGADGTGTPPSPEAGLARTIARLDRLHITRDQPAAPEEARRLADQAVAAFPTSAEVLWRAARAYFTLADLPADTSPPRSPSQRSQLGKIAWDLAERAVAAGPELAAAHYWAALAIGSYAEGIGVLKALTSGIEGKFKGHLQRATELDPTYDHGSIPVVWAAYFLEVPWPKRDRARAEQQLELALRINPDNLRARLYQARLFADTGRRPAARARLAEIAAAPVGRYDPPEERRVKQEAVELATKLAE